MEKIGYKVVGANVTGGTFYKIEANETCVNNLDILIWIF